MYNDSCFSLVQAIQSNTIPYDFAVCAVNENECEVSFVDFKGLKSHLGNRPCVPSIFGHSPAIVSIGAEQQALDAISDALISFPDKYNRFPPAQYEKLHEIKSGGFKVYIKDGRLRLEVSEWECKGLGWQRGDRIALSGLLDSNKFALHLDADGEALIDCDTPGWLSVNRDWPIGIKDFSDNDCLSTPYYLSDYGINFSIEKNDEILSDKTLENQITGETSISKPKFSPVYYATLAILFCLFTAVILTLCKITSVSV